MVLLTMRRDGGIDGKNGYIYSTTPAMGHFISPIHHSPQTFPYTICIFPPFAKEL